MTTRNRTAGIEAAESYGSPGYGPRFRVTVACGPGTVERGGDPADAALPAGRRTVYCGHDLDLAAYYYERAAGRKLSPERRSALWEEADAISRPCR